MTNDFYVYWVKMPVDGMSVPCPGGYTIYLNKKYLDDLEKARKIYHHEVKHAEENDFEKYCVQDIEREVRV